VDCHVESRSAIRKAKNGRRLVERASRNRAHLRPDRCQPRNWRSAPKKGDLELLLFAKSTAAEKRLYEQLKERLVKEVANTVVTPCKTYVGFGNPRQYAVIRPDRENGLVICISTASQALLKPDMTKGLGGGKMKWRIDVRSGADIDLVLGHIAWTNT
jgi:hypothetical protein